MYEALDQFAGYFHEDFRLEYASAEDAIVGFMTGQGSAAVADTVVDIDSLLAASFDESKLDELWMSEFGGNYDPREDGMTYREWFAHVRDLLTRPAPTDPPT